jgi:hypothetical protein
VDVPAKDIREGVIPTMDPQTLVGKRVAFKDDAEHADCWHHRHGLKAGVVLRIGQSLAQKAALLAAENLELPEVSSDEDVVHRVWVKVDPCPSYPRGCEVAADVDCLKPC